MSFRNTFFILILFSILAACNKPEQKENSATEDFFNLPAFFNAEAKRLSANSNLLVDKTVVLNGKKESKELSIKDWNAELTLFSKCHIHDPALKEYYKVSKEAESIIYTAIDKTVNVRRLALTMDGKNIKNIVIETQNSNEVFEATQVLNYSPDKGFSIRKNQKVVLFSEDIFEIDLQFKS